MKGYICFGIQKRKIYPCLVKNRELTITQSIRNKKRIRMNGFVIIKLKGY